jgi:hypothetical protein
LKNEDSSKKTNRMDRIDRMKEMQKAECGMMNERQAAFLSSFILHPSAFLLLSCLSCPSC